MRIGIETLDRLRREAEKPQESNAVAQAILDVYARRTGKEPARVPGGMMVQDAIRAAYHQKKKKPKRDKRQRKRREKQAALEQDTLLVAQLPQRQPAQDGDIVFIPYQPSLEEEEEDLITDPYWRAINGLGQVGRFFYRTLPRWRARRLGLTCYSDLKDLKHAEQARSRRPKVTV